MTVTTVTPNTPPGPEDLATYDEGNVDRDRLRLLIGDTDVVPDSDALFLDSELDLLLEGATNSDFVDVIGAAATACDILATRYARQFDFAEDGQSFSLSQRASAFAARATELRERSPSSGMGSIPLVSSTYWETT